MAKDKGARYQQTAHFLKFVELLVTGFEICAALLVPFKNYQEESLATNG